MKDSGVFSFWSGGWLFIVIILRILLWHHRNEGIPREAV